VVRKSGHILGAFSNHHFNRYSLKKSFFITDLGLFIFAVLVSIFSTF